MALIIRRAAWVASLWLAVTTPAWAQNSRLEGEKQLVLHARDGKTFDIGSVKFTGRADGAADFEISVDPKKTTTYFLSMRNFRCVEGNEVVCHVPYPYPFGGPVAADRLDWLEHGLLFLTKSPQEFGAKFENGLYFRLELTPTGLRGTPQGINLDHIAFPPDDLSIPPYSQVDKYDEPEGENYIAFLTIE